MDAAQGPIPVQPHWAPMQQFACVDADGQDAVYMPLHGFTAVDLGYQQGNAVSNFVNRMDEPSVDADAIFSCSTRSGRTPTRSADVTELICEHIASVYQENSPQRIYFLILYNIFSEFLEDISEDVLPNERTGYQDSVIWQKLYNFQRDAATGIINKLETYNGCILADSVGLGKTFTALAVIKYYELRNRSVLVLCPKKLADNWINYKGNLTEQSSRQGSLQLRRALPHRPAARARRIARACRSNRVNWGNYDLVVIDESHNFRNDDAFKDRETRYQRLMNGSSAGRQDQGADALRDAGQQPLQRPEEPACSGLRRRPGNLSAKLKHGRRCRRDLPPRPGGLQCLVEAARRRATRRPFSTSLDFDFFELLDSVTIARSRRHITTFYDTKEIGEFPDAPQAALVPLPAHPSARRDRLQRNFRSAHAAEAGRLHAGQLHPAEPACRSTRTSTTPRSAAAAAS